jgi:hypothetical protein
MNCMKLTRLAMAGAALLLSAAITAPSSAAPVGPVATQSAIGQTGSNLTEAGYDGHRRGYYRGRHHNGFRFFFAPVVIGDGYYGRSYGGGGGGGPSCYSICRDYHGPDYCRYNWRRYCY